MAPQFVNPFVKSNKNDANDAEAICEAVTRLSMRFVPAKSVEQQDIQLLHRVRSRLVGCRTQLGNQVRGLLMEYLRTLFIHGARSVVYRACRKTYPCILRDTARRRGIAVTQAQRALTGGRADPEARGQQPEVRTVYEVRNPKSIHMDV